MKNSPFKIKENSIKDRDIHDAMRANGGGDDFLFMPIFSGWLGKSIARKTFLLYYIFLVTIFVLLISRLIYLQLWLGDSYRLYAESNRIKRISLMAPRGIIYDKFGRSLVKNTSKFILYINPALLPTGSERADLRQYLNSRFEDSADVISGIFADTSSNRLELAAEDLPYDSAIEISIKSLQFPALQVSNEPRRQYLYANGLEHILGYIGFPSETDLGLNSGVDFNDFVGKSGVERSYDVNLRGKNGFIEYEVDALGRQQDEVSRQAAEKGHDVTLTIDVDVQNQLYSAIRDVARSSGKTAAAAVVMDPKNGEIIAMVSYPGYDPNIFSSTLDQSHYQELVNDPSKPLFMRSIAGQYPPGSTFKMTLASAALEENLIDDRFSVMSTGGLWLGNRFFPDWRPGGHGLTNIYRAISDSVNTFFYIIGGGDDTHVGLGVDTIDRYASRFGFGRPVGIDIPGEASGFVPTKQSKESAGEHWYQGDTYNLSIGQGALLVTPLQLAHYVNFFAVKDRIYTPRLVKKVDGIELAGKSLPVDFQTQFLRSSTVDIIRKALRQTVLSGSAQSMQSVPVAVAGKTGTAQFSNSKEPHSWFTGFAPYESPTIELAVVIEEGGNQGLAVTAARRFLEQYFLR